MALLSRQLAIKQIFAPSRLVCARVAYSTTRQAGHRPENESGKKQHRSKHYNPSKDPKDPSATKVLLEPHVLSARLKKLCDQAQIDAAVSMLKNSPLDAQNIPVWNTLIWECLKAERFRLAYELYVDMKRRGHRPNTRTFQTMMNGLARIDNWEIHTKQLSHAHSVYQAFMRHVDSVKKHDPSSSELSVAPIASYVKILGTAGLHQEIFDVFYSLDAQGPLAPDHLLFTAMFQALTSQPTAETGDFVPNAASAKLLWNLMLKASRRNKFPIDGFLVSSAVTALSRGRPADQDFAFGLVEEFFGLVFDGGDEPVPLNKNETKSSSVPLEPQSFAAVLTLCRNSSRPLHAISFFGAVLQRPESQGGQSIIDRAHIEQVLQSLIATDIPSSSEKALELVEWMLSREIQLSSSVASKIRPTSSTFNLLISHICRAENNWRVATKAFDLMTGYHCHDFMDGVEKSDPRIDRRSPGRNIPVSPEVLSSMMRIAVGTEDRANIRQALRLIYHFRIIRSWALSDTKESKKAMKDKHFYSTKLAEAVLEGIESLSKHSASSRDKPRSQDIVQWKALQTEAREVLASDSFDEFIPRKRAQSSGSKRASLLKA